MASTAENSERRSLPCQSSRNATTSEITKVSVILKMPRYPLIRVHPSTVEYMRIHSFQGFWSFSWKLFWKFGLSSEQLLYVLGFIFLNGPLKNSFNSCYITPFTILIRFTVWWLLVSSKWRKNYKLNDVSNRIQIYDVTILRHLAVTGYTASLF